MRQSKSSLFLMELVIVILFFSISSAVCVQLFVKAHELDKETIAMNHSAVWIQNLSESFRAYNGDMTAISSLYQDQNYANDGSVELHFDNDWKMCSANNEAVYKIRLFQKSSSSEQLLHGAIEKANICVSDLSRQDTILYEQEIQIYHTNKKATEE